VYCKECVSIAKFNPNVASGGRSTFAGWGRGVGDGGRGSHGRGPLSNT
jgi:hypothetical protein